jgi:hypothetical protein
VEVNKANRPKGMAVKSNLRIMYFNVII